MTVVETIDLTKRYGDEPAVDALSLTVRRGEVYGFLGPNGAGKSTTIDVLMDYTRPSDGSATIFGLDTQADATAIHRRTGILPDRFGVYESLTGREHVRYVLDANGDSGDPAGTLDRVGLADAVDDQAGSYSKGMQQRLGLAMALAGDPDLLVLDEPFAGLDPYGVRLVRDVVDDERSRGTTVFFSSHVLDQVERLCDRIGLVANGRLVEEGTPQKLREAAGVDQRLVVGVDGDHDAARTAVSDLAGVDGVHEDEGRLVVVCPPDERYRVLRAIDGAGVSVGRVTVDEGTVEDAFVTLASR